MGKNNYFSEAHRWLLSVSMAVTTALCATGVMAQDVPPAPVNLKAESDYNKVTLTWNRFAKADTLLNEGFEGDEFPPAGWSNKVTNTTDQYCTWHHYPTEEWKNTIDNYADWIFSGEHSACVYFDTTAPHDDGSPSTQDEWLITPAVEGAEYLDFYCFIDPEVLANGKYEEFGDHYYVKVSHDGGKTWEILWDARYDSDGSSGFQLVSLYLGDSSKGAPMVAFHAQSNVDDPDQSLYFAWVIDDVCMSTTPAESAAARKRIAQSPRPSIAGLATHRTFDTTGLTPKPQPARVRKSAPVVSFNVYLDGNLLAENLERLSYTDMTDKTPGTHTYSVTSCIPEKNVESDPAKVEVNIEKATVNPPRNVQVTYEYDESTGKYNVNMTWDAPEGSRKPAYYTAYCNNAMFGSWLEDMNVGQTGIPHGVYDYSVSAVYENPDGESEAIGDQVALGTRYPVRNMKATLNDDGSVSLKWEAPKASEYTVKDYQVFRGNENLNEGTATEFTENAAPDGLYDYSVKVVYADGVVSTPVTQSVSKGEIPEYVLPFSENFTGALKPGNWKVEKLRSGLKDNYTWRFDNWYDLPVSGGNFDGDFASVNCSSAGMTTVTTGLVTPPLVNGTLDADERTWLEFDMDYMTCMSASDNYYSKAYLEYSVDNGATWETLDEPEGYTGEELEAGQTCRPERKLYDVTEIFDKGQPVMFSWSYDSRMAQHWAIDNVKVYNAVPSSISSLSGKDFDCRFDGNTLSISDNGISKVRLYSADGKLLSDVNARGKESLSVPLTGNGVTIVSVTTNKGTRSFSIKK